MEQNVKNIFNSFDEHGTMLNLPRLRGEKNKDYKQRILDAGVNRASSSYDGLINGICRELGLAAYNAISIDIGIPVETEYIPMIDIDHAKLTLYEDYATNLVDLEIELYDNTKAGSAKTLSDVVDAINTSTHFTATLLDAAKGYEPSITLIHQDSNVEIYNETAQSSNIFYLDNANIIPGTISFSEINIFYNRLESYDLSTMNSGEYFVDYSSGKIVVKDVPSGTGTVSYKYRDIPMSLKASPVIIKNMNDEVFQNRLYDQFLAPDGTEYSGLPTSENVDILQEVMSKKGLYWGK